VDFSVGSSLWCSDVDLTAGFVDLADCESVDFDSVSSSSSSSSSTTLSLSSSTRLFCVYIITNLQNFQDPVFETLLKFSTVTYKWPADSYISPVSAAASISITTAHHGTPATTHLEICEGESAIHRRHRCGAT